jgi:hypothetical protein
MTREGEGGARATFLGNEDEAEAEAEGGAYSRKYVVDKYLVTRFQRQPWDHLG